MTTEKWHYEDDGEPSVVNGREVVAKVYGFSPKTIAERGMVMAASPDGLDAAKHALQYLQDYASTDHDDAHYRDGVNHAVELMERFIAKATGAKPLPTEGAGT